MKFNKKRILITGGTRGLGKAMALAFAHAGAWVAVSYATDEESARKTGEELQDIAHSSLVIRADVSSQTAVTDMIDGIIKKWQQIDVLVNNAGIIRDKLLMFLDENDWNRVIDTNLKGTYLCSRAVMKPMIARRAGRIINVTSPSAITGRAGQTNYAASKGGIISFTKSLSREISRFGITVNALCPGVITTAMTESLDTEQRKGLLQMIPMGRFGTPEEVAAAVLFIASDEAAYMTGQTLTVDGGLT